MSSSVHAFDAAAGALEVLEKITFAMDYVCELIGRSETFETREGKEKLVTGIYLACELAEGGRKALNDAVNAPAPVECSRQQGFEKAFSDDMRRMFQEISEEAKRQEHPEAYLAGAMALLEKTAHNIGGC